MTDDQTQTEHEIQDPNSPVVSAPSARQGPRGQRVLIILSVGLGLTAFGFLVVWALWMKPMADGKASTGQQAVDAAAFQDGARVPQADAPTGPRGEDVGAVRDTRPNVNTPTDDPGQEPR